MTNSISHPQVICAGILVADVFIPPLPRLPAAGELVATGDFLADSGGCAANTATALSKLGVTAGVIGKVGEDIFGDFIVTVILPVTGEDRRYVHTFGANADFRESDVDRNLLKGARVFYAGSRVLLRRPRDERGCLP